MHYFSVCSGYYIPSSSNHSVLSSSTTNITCVRRYSGYNFSLHDTVASTLPSEVISLAEKMTAQRWSTMTAINAWYTGVSNVFLSFVALSFTLWRGREGWSETIIMSLVRPSSHSPPLPSFPSQSSQRRVMTRRNLQSY
jgi:hypothetical protein